MSSLKEIDIAAVFSNRLEAAMRNMRIVNQVKEHESFIATLERTPLIYVQNCLLDTKSIDLSIEENKPILALVKADLERRRQNLLDELEVAL